MTSSSSVPIPPTPVQASECETGLRSLLPWHRLRDPALARELAARWCERHRTWHGPRHLARMLDAFAGEPDSGTREILLLAAAYHDAVYHPLRRDNEEASARLLLHHARDRHDPVVVRAAELVNASSWTLVPTDDLTWRFWEADTRPLANEGTLSDRLAYERAVFREYQCVPWPHYRAKRAEFLANWASRFPAQRAGAEVCLELLRGLRPRMAVYPGSFNPFHLGHLSILQRAERVFDKVVIGLALNRQKPGAASDLDQRHAALRERLRFHEVVTIPGLITRFLDEFGAPLAVVRGVRDGTDLEAELRYSRFLEELRPGTNVVWIGCEGELQHLSSSAIRELDSIEHGAGFRYVPATRDIYGLVAEPDPPTEEFPGGAANTSYSGPN